ncbi:MAG: hypothetical protein ABEJ24_05480 [Candidatus Magasanikbacteria bacterium]
MPTSSIDEEVSLPEPFIIKADTPLKIHVTASKYDHKYPPYEEPLMNISPIREEGDFSRSAPKSKIPAKLILEDPKDPFYSVISKNKRIEIFHQPEGKIFKVILSIKWLRSSGHHYGRGPNSYCKDSWSFKTMEDFFQETWEDEDTFPKLEIDTEKEVTD